MCCLHVCINEGGDHTLAVVKDLAPGEKVGGVLVDGVIVGVLAGFAVVCTGRATANRICRLMTGDCVRQVLNCTQSPNNVVPYGNCKPPSTPAGTWLIT